MKSDGIAAAADSPSPSLFITRAFLVCLVGLGAFSTSFAGEVFVAELNPTPVFGEEGDFLSSTFDFGTRFSSIDSVSLQLTSEEGFSGVSFRGGAASANSFLTATVDDGVAATPTLSTAFSFPANDQIAAAFTTRLIADEPATIRLRALAPFSPFSVGREIDSFFPGPDFLLDGRGRVALANVSTLSSLTGLFDVMQRLPAGITDAQLIIVGTAVPEPGPAVLLLTGVLAQLAGFRTRR